MKLKLKSDYGNWKKGDVVESPGPDWTRFLLESGLAEKVKTKAAGNKTKAKEKDSDGNKKPAAETDK